MKAQQAKTRGRTTISVSPAPLSITIPNPSAAKQKKQARRRRRQNSGIPKNSTYLPLKECSLRYLDATLDPFGQLTTEELPCIPDTFVLPSQKLATRMRGTFSIGTNGFGYIAFAPLTQCSDVNVLQITGSTFAGNIGDPVIPGNNAVGTTNVKDVQFPYASGNAALARLVACGLRIRYSGTELNRGGDLIMCRALGKQDFLDSMSTNTILQRQDHNVEAVTRRWHMSVWNPAFPDAVTYQVVNSAITSAGTSFRMGALVTGTAGNTYQYDIVRYWEIVSNDSSAATPTYSPIGVSKSHSDVDGFSAVKDYLSGLAASENGRAILEKGYAYVKAAAFQTASSYVTGAAGVPLLTWKGGL